MTESIVFGARAGRYAAEYARNTRKHSLDEKMVNEKRQEIVGSQYPQGIKETIGTIMWNHVGVIRTRESLERGESAIQAVCAPRDLRSPEKLGSALETRNLSLIARLIIRSSLRREESRGAHYRMDFPGKDDQHWLRNVRIFLDDGEMQVDTRLVVFPHFKPSIDR